MATVTEPITPSYSIRKERTGSMLFWLTNMSSKTATDLLLPMGKTKVTVPTRPWNMPCFLLIVVPTEVKPLLARTTLVVLPVILALVPFTVTLTLVRPRVGVLPILLLATVMTRFPVRSVLIRCNPRLGVICVNIELPRMVPASLAELSPVSLPLAQVTILLAGSRFT